MSSMLWQGSGKCSVEWLGRGQCGMIVGSVEWQDSEQSEVTDGRGQCGMAEGNWQCEVAGQGIVMWQGSIK